MARHTVEGPRTCTRAANLIRLRMTRELVLAGSRTDVSPGVQFFVLEVACVAHT